MLTERLTTLVQYGVMTREPYRDPGSRVRHAYKLTSSGRELHVALGALQLWGDKYLPREEGPTIERRARATSRPVHVGFIDDRGREIDPDEVAVTDSGAPSSRFRCLSHPVCSARPHLPTPARRALERLASGHIRRSIPERDDAGWTATGRT